MNPLQRRQMIFLLVMAIISLTSTHTAKTEEPIWNTNETLGPHIVTSYKNTSKVQFEHGRISSSTTKSDNEFSLTGTPLTKSFVDSMGSKREKLKFKGEEIQKFTNEFIENPETVPFLDRHRESLDDKQMSKPFKKSNDENNKTDSNRKTFSQTNQPSNIIDTLPTLKIIEYRYRKNDSKEIIPKQTKLKLKRKSRKRFHKKSKIQSPTIQITLLTPTPTMNIKNLTMIKSFSPTQDLNEIPTSTTKFTAESATETKTRPTNDSKYGVNSNEFHTTDSIVKSDSVPDDKIKYDEKNQGLNPVKDTISVGTRTSTEMIKSTITEMIPELKMNFPTISNRTRKNLTETIPSTTTEGEFYTKPQMEVLVPTTKVEGEIIKKSQVERNKVEETSTVSTILNTTIRMHSVLKIDIKNEMESNTFGSTAEIFSTEETRSSTIKNHDEESTTKFGQTLDGITTKTKEIEMIRHTNETKLSKSSLQITSVEPISTIHGPTYKEKLPHKIINQAGANEFHQKSTSHEILNNTTRELETDHKQTLIVEPKLEKPTTSSVMFENAVIKNTTQLNKEFLTGEQEEKLTLSPPTLQTPSLIETTIPSKEVKKSTVKKVDSYHSTEKYTKDDFYKNTFNTTRETPMLIKEIIRNEDTNISTDKIYYEESSHANIVNIVHRTVTDVIVNSTSPEIANFDKTGVRDNDKQLNINEYTLNNRFKFVSKNNASMEINTSENPTLKNHPNDKAMILENIATTNTPLTTAHNMITKNNRVEDIGPSTDTKQLRGKENDIVFDNTTVEIDGKFYTDIKNSSFLEMTTTEINTIQRQNDTVPLLDKTTLRPEYDDDKLETHVNSTKIQSKSTWQDFYENETNYESTPTKKLGNNEKEFGNQLTTTATIITITADASINGNKSPKDGIPTSTDTIMKIKENNRSINFETNSPEILIENTISPNITTDNTNDTQIKFKETIQQINSSFKEFDNRNKNSKSNGFEYNEQKKEHKKITGGRFSLNNERIIAMETNMHATLMPKRVEENINSNTFSSTNRTNSNKTDERNKQLEKSKYTEKSLSVVTTQSSERENDTDTDKSKTEIDRIQKNMYIDNLKMEIQRRKSLENEFRIECERIEKAKHINFSNLALKSIQRIDLPNPKSVISLNLSYNSLQNMSLMKHNLNNLKVLYLNNNNLSELNVNNFDTLYELEVIDASNNKISTIRSGTFYGLALLKTLNLAYNQMEEISSKTFKGLFDLTSLDLSYNKIERTSVKSFIMLTELRSLNLSNNNISTIEISNLHNLQLLDLSNNSIESFDDILLSMTDNIKILKINKNLLKVINENYFKPFNQLIHLDLSFNQLVNIMPSTFQYLNNLIFLNISCQHNYKHTYRDNILLNTNFIERKKKKSINQNPSPTIANFQRNKRRSKTNVLNNKQDQNLGSVFDEQMWNTELLTTNPTKINLINKKSKTSRQNGYKNYTETQNIEKQLTNEGDPKEKDVHHNKRLSFKQKKKRKNSSNNIKNISQNSIQNLAEGNFRQSKYDEGIYLIDNATLLEQNKFGYDTVPTYNEQDLNNGNKKNVGQADQRSGNLEKANNFDKPEEDLKSKRINKETAVEFSFNILTSISQKLKQLECVHVNLKQVPRVLTNSIQILNLKLNRIQTIEVGDLDDYPLLQILILTLNKISIIEEDSLGRLDNLKILIVDRNKLTSFPVSLPENIEILNLNNNYINKINKLDLMEMSYLEKLYLANNRITVIQANLFSNLNNLKVLDISNNPIKLLSNMIFKQLNYINLSNMKLISSNITNRFPIDDGRYLIGINLINSTNLCVSLMNDFAFILTLKQIKYLNCNYTLDSNTYSDKRYANTRLYTKLQKRKFSGSNIKRNEMQNEESSRKRTLKNGRVRKLYSRRKKSQNQLNTKDESTRYKNFEGKTMKNRNSNPQLNYQNLHESSNYQAINKHDYIQALFNKNRNNLSTWSTTQSYGFKNIGNPFITALPTNSNEMLTPTSIPNQMIDRYYIDNQCTVCRVDSRYENIFFYNLNDIYNLSQKIISYGNIDNSNNENELNIKNIENCLNRKIDIYDKSKINTNKNYNYKKIQDRNKLFTKTDNDQIVKYTNDRKSTNNYVHPKITKKKLKQTYNTFDMDMMNDQPSRNNEIENEKIDMKNRGKNLDEEHMMGDAPYLEHIDMSKKLESDANMKSNKINETFNNNREFNKEASNNTDNKFSIVKDNNKNIILKLNDISYNNTLIDSKLMDKNNKIFIQGKSNENNRQSQENIKLDENNDNNKIQKSNKTFVTLNNKLNNKLDSNNKTIKAEYTTEYKHRTKNDKNKKLNLGSSTKLDDLMTNNTGTQRKENKRKQLKNKTFKEEETLQSKGNTDNVYGKVINLVPNTTIIEEPMEKINRMEQMGKKYNKNPEFHSAKSANADVLKDMDTISEKSTKNVNKLRTNDKLGNKNNDRIVNLDKNELVIGKIVNIALDTTPNTIQTLFNKLHKEDENYEMNILDTDVEFLDTKEENETKLVDDFGDVINEIKSTPKISKSSRYILNSNETVQYHTGLMIFVAIVVFMIVIFTVDWNSLITNYFYYNRNNNYQYIEMGHNNNNQHQHLHHNNNESDVYSIT